MELLSEMCSIFASLRGIEIVWDPDPVGFGQTPSFLRWSFEFGIIRVEIVHSDSEPIL